MVALFHSCDGRSADVLGKWIYQITLRQHFRDRLVFCQALAVIGMDPTFKS